MIPASSSAFLRLLFAMLAAMTLGACSSAVTGPGGTISKVKYFHLQPGDLRQANQRMLTFEREHIFYGALTAQEISDRFGHYYAFFWKLDDRTGHRSFPIPHGQDGPEGLRAGAGRGRYPP